MKNLLTIRSLNFEVPTKELDVMRQTTKFRDLVAVGTLLNAISFAHEQGVPFELASLAVDRTEFGETVFLTDGLLCKGLELVDKLAERYSGQPCFKEFEHLIDSFTEYNPPEVLVDMRFNGPFRLHTENRGTFNVTGKNELFSTLGPDRKAVTLATMVNTDDLAEDHRRGIEHEAHYNIESVIDCLVDDFTLAAEEFIYAISKQLGLKNPATRDLGLAR